MKACACANGSTQKSDIAKKESTSPITATESVLIAGVIDANQGRGTITLDIPNVFVQTSVPQGGTKIIMDTRGMLVDILIEICPGEYEDFVVMEKGHKHYMCKCRKPYMGC
eukprot:9417548-Ditylum_brightwellii.AAC.1